ncbi:MAG: hypothetical protein ABI354_02285, partial [Candidatus Saccharimonadales bacterium]
RTILGKVKHRKAGGWVVKSVELPRYAYTEKPSPRLYNVPLELLDSYVNHPIFMPTPEADNRAIATIPPEEIEEFLESLRSKGGVSVQQVVDLPENIVLGEG